MDSIDDLGGSLSTSDRGLVYLRERGGLEYAYLGEGV